MSEYLKYLKNSVEADRKRLGITYLAPYKERREAFAAYIESLKTLFIEEEK
jgi:hypothetical protein